VLPVPEVAPLPAEEVVAWVAVEVAAQSADLVPEFGMVSSRKLTPSHSIRTPAKNDDGRFK
jgi:hypothetical protein